MKGHKGCAGEARASGMGSVDNLEYTQYLSRREVKIEKNQKVETMEEDLANVKSELNEIKSLLKELLNGSR